jgi:HSP20 family protein
MFSLVPWRKDNTREETSLARRDDNPFALLRREFDTLFDQFFRRGPLAFMGEGGPVGWGFDVEDNGKDITVRAEAPGFEAGDFDVQVSGDLLRLKAEKKQETAAQEGQPATRGFRRFERTVTLPAGVDPDKVEAHYRNGVLEVRLPRTEEALGRRIEVKT